MSAFNNVKDEYPTSQQKKKDLEHHRLSIQTTENCKEFVSSYPRHWQLEPWKYDLNPITGLPAVKNHHLDSQRIAENSSHIPLFPPKI